MDEGPDEDRAVLHNLFIVAALIAVTIALTSMVILIAGARERAARDGGVDGVHLDPRGANDG
jgi:hypothetical protein